MLLSVFDGTMEIKKGGPEPEADGREADVAGFLRFLQWLAVSGQRERCERINH
jgi:hypothetical protein